MTPATDDFWKHCDKRKKCSKFLLLQQCFQENITSFIEIFQYFNLELFKIVYWRFVVCGTGLMPGEYGSCLKEHILRWAIKGLITLLCVSFSLKDLLPWRNARKIWNWKRKKLSRQKSDWLILIWSNKKHRKRFLFPWRRIDIFWSFPTCTCFLTHLQLTSF